MHKSPRHESVTVHTRSKYVSAHGYASRIFGYAVRTRTAVLSAAECAERQAVAHGLRVAFWTV